MLRAWRGRFFTLLFFIQAFVLGLALQLSSPRAWSISLPLLALLNMAGWITALRMARAINDTPTSRVASAAQGYVELRGRAQPHQGQQLLTPHTQLPCLWYRYRVERLVNNRWQHQDSGESQDPFDLEDASGRCCIEPRGAHIQTTHKETRREGNLRYTEEVLLKDDQLYALGGFHSVNGHDQVLNARLAVGELLGEWKKDPEALYRRFDLDGDGNISAREWALARLAARREIARQHAAIRAQAPKHFLSRPDDGRPFLISNQSPEQLGHRFILLAWLFLGLMLGSLGLLVAILTSMASHSF